MPISAISPVSALHSTEQSKSAPGSSNPEAQVLDAVQKTDKVFTPAPPLRPNIQDLVDINRVLIALRGVPRA